MPKRYVHQDRFVELEFQNLFTELRKQHIDIAQGARGERGSDGAAGPDGAPGQSGIQTLIKLFTDSGELGTVPKNSLVFDLWCVLYSWDGPNDLVSFQLQANSVDVVDTEVQLTPGAPQILWPPIDFFDGSHAFYGSLAEEDLLIEFVSPKTGQFLVCLNYIPTVGLLT